MISAYKTAATDNGFSMVELLIVMSIIGILSAIGITSWTMYMDNAEFSRVVKTVHDAKTALEDGVQNMSELGGFVAGWTGSHGESLKAPLDDALPGMAVPDGVKMWVSRMDCNSEGRYMDNITVIACKRGVAQWYVTTCGGWTLTGPKMNFGPGFC